LRPSFTNAEQCVQNRLAGPALQPRLDDNPGTAPVADSATPTRSTALSTALSDAAAIGFTTQATEMVVLQAAVHETAHGLGLSQCARQWTV